MLCSFQPVEFGWTKRLEARRVLSFASTTRLLKAGNRVMLGFVANVGGPLAPPVSYGRR